MAVFRPTPKCPFCGKEIAKAIHKDYSDLPMIMRPIGDSFIRWDYIKHSCRAKRKYEKEYAKRPEVIKAKQEFKEAWKKLEEDIKKKKMGGKKI